MKLREAARAALAGLPAGTIERGSSLLKGISDGSFTARFDDGGALITVVLEVNDEGSRLACTCGALECEHQSALLSALAGDEGFMEAMHESLPEAVSPTTSDAPSRPTTTSIVELADAVDGLVEATCKHGLNEEAEERDVALASVIALLAGQDLPDLKRAVATVRRTLTSSTPDAATALAALSRLTRLTDELRRTVSPTDPRGLDLRKHTERKEEVKLLEIARYTQRTPFGDRRDVVYFLDLDEDVLYRELAASTPGSAPASLSEGPFGKRLLGNLVTIEEGTTPRRIRMLQYATIGFATEEDLDHLLACCESEVDALYASVRDSIGLGLDAAEKVVMFAPDRVLASPSGGVLCDEVGDLLPLARGRNPSLCSTVDLLARRGRLLAVVGQLVLGSSFISILPLTAVVELETGRSLRRIA